MKQIVRDERVVFMLSEDELDDLEKAAEAEPNCTSRSDFIRLAITQKIHGILDREAVEELEFGLDDDAINEVETSVASIANEMGTLRDEIVDAIQTSEFSAEEVDQLARQIFDVLPQYQTAEEFLEEEAEVVESYHVADAKEYIDRAQTVSNPRSWARWFDVPIPVARRACALLTEYFPGEVEFIQQKWEHEDGRTVHDPERRYYRIPRDE